MKIAAVKQNALKARPNIPYPNAATTKELVHRFLNLATMAGVGAAMAAAALFLMAIL